MQKRGACKFFLWYDPPIPQKMKNTLAAILRELRSTERENVALKIEISKLKAKVKVLFLACTCCCILVVAILGCTQRQNGSFSELKMLQ